MHHILYISAKLITEWNKQQKSNKILPKKKFHNQTKNCIRLKSMLIGPIFLFKKMKNQGQKKEMK